jgi:hypothetical protein
MLEVIARGMALGHLEYYLTKPWRPVQHLLYARAISHRGKP